MTCFAGVFNFPGAVAARFLLGVFEAAVTPGFALLTGQVSYISQRGHQSRIARYSLEARGYLSDSVKQWYTKHEQATRVGIWFSFNGWGQLFGGFLAYGIAVGSRINGSAIAPWKTVFLVTGLLTAALGVWFWWVIPDNQLNARWLKKEDRVLAVERVRVNQQGIGNKHFKMYQLKEALTDPITWAFVYYSIAGSIPNGELGP